MAKRILLLLPLLLLTTLPAAAQQTTDKPRYGYLSYNAVYQAMPEYEEAQKKMSELKATYDAEAKRAQEEFQRKFAEFMQGQKDFPENIMLKRQYELQTLMEQNIQFKEESEQLLRQAENELQAQITILVDEAIRAVGLENNLQFIFNTDGKTTPFIHPDAAIDVTALVRQKLQLSAAE